MNKYGGKISERNVNYYTQMILKAPLDVHEKGFIHSALKLCNILAFPPQHGIGLPTLKITDFGLKKLFYYKPNFRLVSIDIVASVGVAGHKHI
ncbi:hypothetical protein J1N35_002326 [Gossypium stocksii]|uniref:Protein kinase domain-containing protein n=1 Tax=Gossypium stocksii TaxID=47602 RepID=A0A9D3WMA4_9ROSI|nr:hypothetical protein J1N35_002326 [Gossypium stocksii]